MSFNKECQEEKIKMNCKEIYLEDYYLKLKIKYNDQIQIIIYNIDKLDGIKYELLLDINEIYKLSDIFRCFSKIEDIFIAILNLIENNKYKIEYNKNTIIFSLIVTDIFNKSKEIKLILSNKDKKYIYNEYIDILTKEIKKLKSIHKLLNELKEENKKIKEEIIILKNIINKSNKNNKITLNEFGNKYKLNLSGKNITTLDLTGRFVKNYNIFDDLCKLDLIELKNLLLVGNNIFDINSIEFLKTENLVFLDLSNNEISDLKVFEKVNFRELKKLFLVQNYIKYIGSFKNSKMENLEILSLNDNKIYDISVFKQVNFKNLKELYLDNNDIYEIDSLNNPNFEKIEKISLMSNKISKIEVFEKVNFKHLNKLYLNNNFIIDISPLKNPNFTKFEKISFTNNKIYDISILEKVN